MVVPVQRYLLAHLDAWWSRLRPRSLLRLSRVRPALPKSWRFRSERSCASAHERRRVHLERQHQKYVPPMPKFFEVLHMSGTPECWIHIIIDLLFSHVLIPVGESPNSCNPLQISRLEVLISPRVKSSSLAVDQLESDRIQLDNVRTFGFFGLDVLPWLS